MSDKNDLAEDRTDWAEDRTVMANERTFAGWMRTGGASLGIAVGLSAVFRETEPTWLAKAVAMIFVATSLIIFEVARRAACRVYERLESHQADPLKRNRMNLVAWCFMAGTFCAGGILWIL